MPRNPWANVTAEEYEQWCDRLSAAHKARWADPEKRAKILAARGALDHSACEHPNTQRARRACRRARVAQS